MCVECATVNLGANPTMSVIGSRTVTGVLPLVLLALCSMGECTDEETANGTNETRLFLPYLSTSTTPSTIIRPYERSCPCSCGEPFEDTRIVGGSVTKAHEYPWMARLSYFNRFYCAGTLINDRYVVSAAHCVRGFIWFLIRVTFGEHDRCDKNVKPESRFVVRAFIGRFSFLNFENDISLLRLNDRLEIRDTIRPICLPSVATETYEGKMATALGWGTLQEDGTPACKLHKVDLPVISNDECKVTNYSSSVIADGMMCAGYKEGGKDSCQGDSGGPLVHLREDNKYELIGIVSWGNGCARPGYPGIYTRVTRYINWITQYSGDGCFCAY